MLSNQCLANVDPGPIVSNFYFLPTPYKGADIHIFHFPVGHMASSYVQPMGILGRILVNGRKGEVGFSLFSLPEVSSLAAAASSQQLLLRSDQTIPLIKHL